MIMKIRNMRDVVKYNKDKDKGSLVATVDYKPYWWSRPKPERVIRSELKSYWLFLDRLGEAPRDECDRAYLQWFIDNSSEED